MKGESDNILCALSKVSMVDQALKIWEGKNNHVHGKTNEEARNKAREAVLAKVARIYKNPPRLASQYPSVLNTPFEQRKKRTTAQLSEWLHRHQHQIHISNILHSTLPPGQHTLKQAFMNHGYSTHHNVVYPPNQFQQQLLRIHHWILSPARGTLECFKYGIYLFMVDQALNGCMKSARQFYHDWKKSLVKIWDLQSIVLIHVSLIQMICGYMT